MRAFACTCVRMYVLEWLRSPVFFFFVLHIFVSTSIEDAVSTTVCVLSKYAEVTIVECLFFFV